MSQPLIKATPTQHALPFRSADFKTLVEAIDYAAEGDTGANFYTGRGNIYASLSYRQLRQESLELAAKLLGLGASFGDRVALVAESTPDFIRFFCACQYAGLIPVALPASVKIGAHETYVQQLRELVKSSSATIAMASSGYLPFLREACEEFDMRRVGTPEAFYELPLVDIDLPTIDPEDISYIQYTSGSTRFPRGVIIKHRTALANIQGISEHGLLIRPGDRMVSWLPFYHDMGLVGFVLTPIATQSSVDYLDTREFAMRPRQWLNLMTQTKATISFSPSFGYDLCARRLRSDDLAKYDLSHWRIAGVGAEMISPQTLENFAAALAPCGFDPKAFTPCYGMAECTLGVAFTRPGTGFSTHYLDCDHLAAHHEAVIHDSSAGNLPRCRHFVNCGEVLPGFEVEVRDRGRVLGDRQSGVIFLRGPSVMTGYFNLPEETRQVLSEDGWLDTGDIGYMSDGLLTITGRKKDLIIIHGRNIWPQDIEHIAESVPGIRVGDAVAFSAMGAEGEEVSILQVQCREKDMVKRAELVNRLTTLVRMEVNLDCEVYLVPPRSLPRTSSGKLSRAKARQNFMEAMDPYTPDTFSEPAERRVAKA